MTGRNPSRERAALTLELPQFKQNVTGRVNANRRLLVEDILDAATEVFAKKGYLGTNLNDVAEKLGVTRQALYYHFRAKHDILTTIFEYIFHDLGTAIDLSVESTDDPVERFRRMVRAHIRVVISMPHRASILLLEYRNLPPLAAKRTIEQRERLLGRFASAYSDAVVAGGFRDVDPMIVAQLIIGAGTSMHRWFRPSGKLSVDEIATLAEGLLIDGYTHATGKPSVQKN